MIDDVLSLMPRRFSPLWRSPEVWRLATSQRSLREAIEQSRRQVSTLRFERLQREFVALQAIAKQIASEATHLRGTLNAPATHALGNRVADYYRKYGDLEQRIEAEIRDMSL